MTEAKQMHQVIQANLHKTIKPRVNYGVSICQSLSALTKPANCK